MQHTSLSRRIFLGAAGAAGFAAANSRGFGAEPAETFPKSAEEALARLKEGNKRFAAGKVQHAHQAADWRTHLATGQQPFATILGCSDSRVPIELVFDQGFGDMFVIRVAGNVIADDVIGSIGYGLRHLKTPLLVVMGHEGCGAVTAALAAIGGGAPQAKYIQTLVQQIEPALKSVDPKLEGPARLSAAVEANVRWSADQLHRLPEAQQFREQNVLLVRAVYDIKTGTVRFLE